MPFVLPVVGCEDIDNGKQVSSTKVINDVDTIESTINHQIQQVVECELRSVLKQYEAKSAFGLMADPKTGEVLALARVNIDGTLGKPIGDPPYDLKEFEFEPASMMKPLTLALALDKKTINLDSFFDCENGYWENLNIKDSYPYQHLSVKNIIIKSSNIGTVKAVMTLAKEQLYNGLVIYGFGQPISLELKEPYKGTLINHTTWSSIILSRIAMGQCINVTPSQLVQSYCALSNDGLMTNLTLQKGNKISSQRVISSNVSRDITECLVSESNITIPNINIAGKAATMQKYINGEGYSNSKYYSSFIGYAPAEDSSFVLCVIIDEPNGEIKGSVVAEPVFQRISEQALLILKK